MSESADIPVVIAGANGRMGRQAVQAVNIPVNDPARADEARRVRVHMAVFLTMASPEYVVLK